ncbi:MAG TPA: rhodanese-like domain-containing protein [Chthonomonadaceae bacterium]|nr:rhodanese-like domain-containing protein [Chthonomonadaceae bacterium]
MILETVFTEGLAHLSYLIGDDSVGAAAVIDPRRDVDIYLQLARQNNVRITHILETHIHADFVSGSHELAARTGAPIYVGAADNYGFEHRPLQEGDRLELGSLLLQVLHTPGHTPEHICFVASEGDHRRPWGVFTGDTLFAGEVGRPDLLGHGTEKKLAADLFHSLKAKLMALPADVIVYPSHGEGSPCGGNIAGRRTSTIGYERQKNPRLQIDAEEAFICSLLGSLPPAPVYYPRLKKTNAAGPKVLGALPEPPLLSAQEFHAAAQTEDALIVDTRTILGFGGGHIAGALSIELREEFPIWAGWMVAPEKNVLLLLRDKVQLDEVVRHLIRLGCERIGGYMAGMRSWQESGLPMVALPPLFVQDLKAALDHGEDLQLLDVRRQDEYAQGCLPNARHIYVPEIEQRAHELDKNRPVVTYCGSGYRSSIAASQLQRLGFADVRNVPGSIRAWKAAGYPLAVPTASPIGSA